MYRKTLIKGGRIKCQQFNKHLRCIKNGMLKSKPQQRLTSTRVKTLQLLIHRGLQNLARLSQKTRMQPTSIP